LSLGSFKEYYSISVSKDLKKVELKFKNNNRVPLSVEGRFSFLKEGSIGSLTDLSTYFILKSFFKWDVLSL